MVSDRRSIPLKMRGEKSGRGEARGRGKKKGGVKVAEVSRLVSGGETS